MPKLAFPIGRTGIYRTLGPIIEAALEDPYWEVELLLGSADRSDDLKAYQNPTLENVPVRLRGRCNVVMICTPGEMVANLNKADVVISISGRSRVVKGLSMEVRSLWSTVFDADHSVSPSLHFDEADMNFWPSRYYLEWALQSGVGTREWLEARGYEIGYVRSDSLKFSSRAATRREWMMDLQQPAVLYIPDGYRLARNAVFVTEWYRHVWCVESRMERLARALIFRRQWRAIRQSLGEKGSHAKIVRAVRQFCDRQGAQLAMVPRRRKEWLGDRGFTAEELDAADYILSAGEDYPQMLPRAAQMADLVICAYPSGALLDAVAAGVPYITVDLPSIGNSPDNEAYARHFRREQGHHPGATWLIPAKEFIGSFSSKALSDFTIDPLVLEEVRAKYVGPVDGACSQRLLEAVRKRLDA